MMMEMSKLYVQFGSGSSGPEEWLNYDASPTLRLQRLPLIGALTARGSPRFAPNIRYGDIVKGLPIAANSCAGIYCCHVLEHLAFEECQLALKNVFSYLEMGGIFRCVLPDLRGMIDAYLSNPSANAAARFMEYTGLGTRVRKRGAGDFAREWFGHSRHLWHWDEKALRSALSEAGFRLIRRAAFNDCEDKRFALVECQDRFVDAMALECRK